MNSRLHARGHSVVKIGLAVILAATAVFYAGYHLRLMLGREETGVLETPIVLSVAVQWTKGVGALYGPFTGSNPTVMIHAPLFYRIAAPMGWPLVGSGLDPVTAGLIVGRLLALLGMVAGCAAAYRLAVLDDGSRRAGVLAVLLIAASPVAVIHGVMVRPDTIGSAFQMLGVVLVLRALRDGPPKVASLAAAYAAFGLAACTKQNNVMALATSSALLGWSWARGRARLGPIAAAHAVGLGLVVAYFGAEQWLTGGRMARCAFLLPSGPLRAITPGSWELAQAIGGIVAWKSAGLLALAAACVWALGRRIVGRPLDRLLILYLAAELAILPILCSTNGLAGENYALQAVILACIVVARALDRAAEGLTPARQVPLFLAALALLAVDVDDVARSARDRNWNGTLVRRMLADPAVASCGPGERFFAGMGYQWLNRLHGRPDLIHDEWLFPAFELSGIAEPRSAWLRDALLRGGVRQVILARPELYKPVPIVPGVPEPLAELGYVEIARHGRYHVWQRPRTPADALARRPPRAPGSSAKETSRIR